MTSDGGTETGVTSNGAIEPGQVEIDRAVLAAHPLPDHSGGSDKHDRGTVLVVGGSPETPGAVLLAGLAALRAGAGRLQIALAAPDASALAVATPEARVLAVGDLGTEAGTDRHHLPALGEAMEQADAVLVGSGATPAAARELLMLAMEAMAGTAACLVVDAAALTVIGEDPGILRGREERTLLIPNAAEASKLVGVDRDEAPAPPDLVREVVQRTGCTVAVRGPETCVLVPGGRRFVERSGPVGLATSGSGDGFAGLVTGFVARGADPLAATLWAVRAHAVAGSLAAERHGPVNFLARELVDLLPQAQREMVGPER